MTEQQKQAIFDCGKEYFRRTIIPNHKSKFESLGLNDFKIDFSIIKFLTASHCKTTETQDLLAKALIYPKVIETSINTCFEQNSQSFMSQLLQVIGEPSEINGIDFEYVDTIDGRRKYCLCKSIIDAEKDLDEILCDCKKAMLAIDDKDWKNAIDDIVVVVPFGKKEELSEAYKIVATTYTVLCGAEFWEHLTGYSDFYNRMLAGFCMVLDEEQICRDLVEEVIENLK